MANLLLARGMARQREIAVRSSLGATRAQVFAQFLTESVVLAAIGGVLGVVLAKLLLTGIMALMPSFTLPSEADVRLSVPVLLFTLAASLLAGILFGCAPAWQATRSELVETLKEAGREIQLHALGRGHTNGDLYIYLPKEKVVATGDALIDWMPLLNDGFPEEWVQTLTALDKLDFTQIIPGHGDVQPKAHLAFFRGYISDLIDAVKKASAGGASLAEMQAKIGDQLAPKYEAGMSKHTLGRYRDRIGQNVEMVHKKVVLKA